MLARYADGRRIQAASLVAFGVVFPLAFIFGAGAAVLSTLRRGVPDGLLVSVLGVGFVGVLLVFAGAGLVGLPAFLAGLAICVAMADVLRRSRSLDLAVQAGLGIAVAALVVLLLGVDDAEGYWRALLVRAMDQMATQGSTLTEAQREAWLQAVPFNAMSGMVIGMGLLLCWGGLFIGRSWQARLVNPGGFRQEFHQLRLGRVLAYLSAGVFFGVALLQADWLLNMAALLIHVWIVQGLSYVHWIVGHIGGRGAWLVLVYAILILFWLTGNQLAILVPVLGIIGEMADLRMILARVLPKK